MDIKFSIIVPVYGVEKYLRVCLDSLAMQAFSSYEVILVDDGSPDDCPRICDEYAAKYRNFRVIHKPNDGLVSARKAGAAIARGRYICCVDGDDFVGVDYLPVIDKLIDRYDPDVLCFEYCTFSPEKCIRVDAYGKLDSGLYDRSKIKEHIFPKLITAEDGSYFLPSVWSKVYRKELYERYQMAVDNRITMGEDGACTIPLISHADTLIILKQPLYFYRSNPESMTKGRKRYNWDNQLYIAGLLYRETDRGIVDFRDQMYRRIVRGFITTAKSQFNGSESYRSAKREILDRMKERVFAEAIDNCRFRNGSKLQIAASCLKKRLIFPFYLANRLSR